MCSGALLARGSGRRRAGMRHCLLSARLGFLMTIRGEMKGMETRGEV